MANYLVHLTFETPAQQAPLRVAHRLPGRAASMQWLGGGGSLAVTARVRAESPVDAAQEVVRAVTDRWLKDRGPIRMRSWRADRSRVMAGLGGRGGASWSAGSGGAGDDGGGGDGGGGTAGVREPRRPLPGPGSLQAAVEPPGPQPGPAR